MTQLSEAAAEREGRERAMSKARCQDVRGMDLVPAYRTCGCIYDDGHPAVICDAEWERTAALDPGTIRYWRRNGLLPRREFDALTPDSAVQKPDDVT